MWQTDTVYLQTFTETSYAGSVKRAWTRGDAVLCDVQEINKEYVYKEYGFEEYTEYRQIFDLTNANWIKGNQVEYEAEQWIVRLVNNNMQKMGFSNHTYVIISKVVG